MTYDEAKKIMSECREYIGEGHPINEAITLDGEFTMDELRAIVVVHEHEKAEYKARTA